MSNAPKELDYNQKQEWVLSQLKEMASAAIIGDKDKVIMLLKCDVNYRQAILFIEAFFQDKNAVKLINELAKCSCGNLAYKWNPEPICASCAFAEDMSKIEFGTPNPKPSD